MRVPLSLSHQQRMERAVDHARLAGADQLRFVGPIEENSPVARQQSLPHIDHCLELFIFAIDRRQRLLSCFGERVQYVVNYRIRRASTMSKSPLCLGASPSGRRLVNGGASVSAVQLRFLKPSGASAAGSGPPARVPTSASLCWHCYGCHAIRALRCPQRLDGASRSKRGLLAACFIRSSASPPARRCIATIGPLLLRSAPSRALESAGPSPAAGHGAMIPRSPRGEITRPGKSARSSHSIAASTSSPATPSPRRSAPRRSIRRRTNRAPPPGSSRAAQPPSASPSGRRRPRRAR